MAKFLSYDGVDANGVRAQVMVQTGTGRIKEIVGRGRQAEDGSYRNVEVVFDPDNPHLKRKVYALLDTTAKELWDYVQAAQSDQRDIAYRIESQRKRGVDRKTSFDDLQHTEEVVRVLAAVDNVFSHEAKTNPKEDPSGENPSALDQDPALLASAGSSSGGMSADKATALVGLATARQSGMPQGVVDHLVAICLAAGASLNEVQDAGFNAPERQHEPVTSPGRVVATEEKPWMAYNSDGRVNAGSYMVAHAATAEQFALDHLVSIYSQGKKSPVDVSDEMIAQAAAIALQLLECADEVQVGVTGGRADRQKNSYNRALALVIDAVGKRYPAPLGGNDQERDEWRTAIVAEAGERLYGVMEVAQGKLPLAEAERNSPPPTSGAATTPATAEMIPAEVEVAVESEEPSAVDIVTAGLGGSVTVLPQPTFERPKDIPGAEDAGYILPDDAQVNRVRALCEAAGVIGDPKAISDWLEVCLGVRATRRAHSPALEQFLVYYEAKDPAEVRVEIVGGAA